MMILAGLSGAHYQVTYVSFSGLLLLSLLLLLEPLNSMTYIP